MLLSASERSGPSRSRPTRAPRPDTDSQDTLSDALQVVEDVPAGSSTRVISSGTRKPLDPARWIASGRAGAAPSLTVSKSDSSNAETLYLEASLGPSISETPALDRSLDHNTKDSVVKINQKCRAGKAGWSESAHSVTAEAGSQINLVLPPTPKLGSISPIVFAPTPSDQSQYHATQLRRILDENTSRGPQIRECDTLLLPQPGPPRHSCKHQYHRSRDWRFSNLWPYDNRGFYAHHPDDPRRHGRGTPSRSPITPDDAQKTEESKISNKKRTLSGQAKSAWRAIGLHKLTKMRSAPPEQPRMPNSAIPHPPWGACKYRSDDDDLRSDDSDGDVEVYLKHRQARNAHVLGEGRIRIRGVSLEQYDKFRSRAYVHVHRETKSKRPRTAPSDGQWSTPKPRPRYTGGHCPTCAQMRPPAPPDFLQLNAHRNRKHGTRPSTAPGMATTGLTAPSRKHYSRDIQRPTSNQGLPAAQVSPTQGISFPRVSSEKLDGHQPSRHSTETQPKIRPSGARCAVLVRVEPSERISMIESAMSHLELEETGRVSNAEEPGAGTSEQIKVSATFGWGSRSSFGPQ